MEKHYLVLCDDGASGISWLGEWPTQVEAQAAIEERLKEYTEEDEYHYWIVETVGRYIQC
jgi:hypothetical protein